MADPQHQSTNTRWLAGEVAALTDDVRRHRRALIATIQRIRGCEMTGARCRASEDCACCQDYEEAIRHD